MDFRALTATSAAAGALLFAVSAPGASAFVIVRLTTPVPALLSAGEALKLAGSVHENPSGTHVALEARGPAGAFAVVARTLVRAHRFELSWLPPAGTSSTVRLLVRDRGRVLARSSSLQVTVGPAPRYCPAAAAPAPASVPAGDGWVQGGVYDSGGPTPGIFSCHAGPYEIAALDEAGEATLTAKLPGLDSYTLVLAPGSYQLEAQEASCFSEEFTITAGAGTRADTICELP